MSKLIKLQGVAHVAEVLEGINYPAWRLALDNIESTFEARREGGQPEEFIQGCEEAIALIRPKLKNQAEDHNLVKQTA